MESLRQDAALVNLGPLTMTPRGVEHHEAWEPDEFDGHYWTLPTDDDEPSGITFDLLDDPLLW